MYHEIRPHLGRAVAILVLLAAPSAQTISGAEDAGEKVSPASEEQLPLSSTSDARWLDSLAKAYIDAREHQRPILVRGVADWCVYCRELAEEMQKPVIDDQLSRWTLVEIDIEDSPQDAALLAIDGVPALRLLTPTGKMSASRDGFSDADELADWLQGHYEDLTVTPAQELTEDGKLTAIGLVRLMREFQRQDATLREAAIRRLLPLRDSAAISVVSAFEKGPLSTRLAALDVLTEWDAPIDGLDPWQPETITDNRLEHLSQWAMASTLAGDDNAEPAAGPASDVIDLEAARASLRALLSATPGEAEAIRERLARHRKVLLPVIYAELQEAETDLERERLTALRYRVVASDQLALTWPGGLDRLAATNTLVREQAADELAKRATKDEEDLLLELFSDAAPLVREISLHALRQIGGSDANSALIRLLDDPDPNVRAAVLKQLAESKSRTVIPKIVEYALKETDSDLVVHAVRVLKESKSKESVDGLIQLLTHESWQVRADAAEALGTAANEGSQLTESRKADVYLALVGLLKDEDSFVISRAITALANAELASVIDPLADVATSRPELAVQTVKALQNSGRHSAKAVKYLRGFCSHNDPQVRAAALTALWQRSPDSARDELRAALQDPDRHVRIAAAKALFEHRTIPSSVGGESFFVHDSHVTTQRTSPSPIGMAGLIMRLFLPQSTTLAVDVVESDIEFIESDVAADPNLEDGSGTIHADTEDSSEIAAEEGDPDAVLKSRTDQSLPDWMESLPKLLGPMLASETAEERVAAALPLAQMGRKESALPVLMAAADEAWLRPQIAQALPLLMWEDRLALLRRLTEVPGNAATLGTITERLVEHNDRRAAAPLWEYLARDDMNSQIAQALVGSLGKHYLRSHVYDPSELPERMRKTLIDEAKPWAESGSKWQRLAALSLLISVAPSDAAEFAQKSFAKNDLADGPRTDLFQIMLQAQSPEDARQSAIEGLSSEIAGIRNMAVAHLATGHTTDVLTDSGFALRSSSPYGGALAHYQSMSSSSGKVVIPKPPEGLTADPLLPFLNSGDAQTAAYAGYLLVLLEHPEGLANLLDYWKEHARTDDAWSRLVYRAISHLDDSSKLPYVEEIYERFKLQEYSPYMGDLYWTVRIMTGPSALALRKRIRDEVGVDALR